MCCSRVGIASGKYLWSEPLQQHWATLDAEGNPLPADKQGRSHQQREGLTQSQAQGEAHNSPAPSEMVQMQPGERQLSATDKLRKLVEEEFPRPTRPQETLLEKPPLEERSP